MRLKTVLALILFFGITQLFAFDQDKEYVLLYLKDKPNISYEKLVQTFSSLALERRVRQQLTFDDYDYPINQEYVSMLIQDGYDVVDSSNWLNAVLILVDNEKGKLEHLLEYTFVLDYQFLGGKSWTEQYTT